MAVPTGEIVARPMMARACGCMCEFQHYAVDKYRAQRLAKFQSTRCAECVAKSEEARRQAQAELPGKGEAIQSLPPGTQIFLARRPDGKWTGKLTQEETTVEALADWPQGLSGTLARLWAAAKGIKIDPEAAAAKLAPPPAKPAAPAAKPGLPGARPAAPAFKPAPRPAK
jgi:hypothetical protein